MKKKLLFHFILTGVLLLPVPLFGQYYDLGQSPASIKWDQVKKNDNRIIYPQGNERQAARILNYFDTIRPYISYGFKHGTMPTPLVLHSQNFLSNGLVMWGPKRTEWVNMPSINAYSEPWLKQLATHELRHNVQFNNLDKNFIKGLSYVIGQQANLLSLGLIPVWFIEGDATLCETQMSSFGRGLQPSFTLEYRTYNGEGEGRLKFATDKWFCGSYKDMIPDHYQLGYQITSYADTKYGENIWDKATEFSAKYPFLILTTKIALYKNYRTSVNKLFRETYTDLNQFWSSQPKKENSAEIISTTTTSHTTYLSPVAVDENTVYAVKSDFDRSRRIVKVNPKTSAEEVICHIGMINSPLTYNSGRLYWSEYRGSTLWDQRVNSEICSLDINAEWPVRIKGERQALFPVAMPEGGVAFVKYNYDGSYTLKHNENSLTLPDTVSIHGLAYDDFTDHFYFIGLSDTGMWLGSADKELNNATHYTKPARITLSDLKASKGKLYYGSIKSGKDEAHILDIKEGVEYLATSSTYGSFSPSPTYDGEGIVLTTYGRQGYLLSQQNVNEKTMPKMAHSLLPENKINPERRKWDVMNIDTVTVCSEFAKSIKPKRYRKGLNMFNFHSWAPWSYDSEDLESILDEGGAGVSLMSQNLLGSTISLFNYTYTETGSKYSARVKYYGLPVSIELKANYGGGDQIVIEKSKVIPLPALNKHFDISANFYTHFRLPGGYHTRFITPAIEFSHYNGLLLNEEGTRYKSGVELMKSSIQFIDNVAMAYRDFLPKWGYAIKFTTGLNPVRSDFGKIWSLYGRGYLPGIMPHHSIRLRSTYTHLVEERFNLNHMEVFPRSAQSSGMRAMKHYAAGSFDYQFPLCYPDRGINSIVYFKRIMLNLGVDYAKYKVLRQPIWKEVYSYGGDIYFDINLFRMPAAANCTIQISIYKPNDSKKVITGVNFSLPI